jgi:hypothetical protein
LCPTCRQKKEERLCLKKSELAKKSERNPWRDINDADWRKAYIVKKQRVAEAELRVAELLEQKQLLEAEIEEGAAKEQAFRVAMERAAADLAAKEQVAADLAAEKERLAAKLAAAKQAEQAELSCPRRRMVRRLVDALEKKGIKVDHKLVVQEMRAQEMRAKGQKSIRRVKRRTRTGPFRHQRKNKFPKRAAVS